MHLAVIVLAAGKGTRMKSDLPKVLHRVAGRSLIEWVLAAAEPLEANETVVVIGHGADAVALLDGELGDRQKGALPPDQGDVGAMEGGYDLQTVAADDLGGEQRAGGVGDGVMGVDEFQPFPAGAFRQSTLPALRPGYRP